MRVVRALKFVGLCVAGGALFGCSDGDPDQLETLVEPPKIESRDGVLQAELTAAHSEINFQGHTVTSQVYNDRFVPPTLQLDPGDTIELTLKNELTDPTNLHYHGMNVSPLPSAAGQGDDVFLVIRPGEDTFYSIDVPPGHPPGMYYYHPHQHGLTESQIGNGMSGAIMVNGLLDPFPQLRGIKTHLLLLKDLQILDDGTVAVTPDTSVPTQRTVNGQVTPTIGMRPGEMQLWSVGNVGADIYYHLVLEGHTFYEIARDGQRHTRLVPRESILLPTAARTQFLVIGGEPGTYEFRTLTLGNQPPNYERYFADDGVYDSGPCGDRGIDNRSGCEESDASTCMGPQADCAPEARLATLVVGGDRVETPPLPTTEQFPAVEDLRGQETCPPRVFNFEEDPSGSPFFINGKPFMHDVINTTVRLGCVEEWTINNCTGENHVFHIHQLDFQVIEVNGAPVEFVGRQDTINMPWRDCIWQDEANGVCATTSEMGMDFPLYTRETSGVCDDGQFPRGQVKVIIPFTDPVIAGKFVYHCHIGEHEDNGMMQTIEVCNDENVPCPPDVPSPARVASRG